MYFLKGFPLYEDKDPDNSQESCRDSRTDSIRVGMRTQQDTSWDVRLAPRLLILSGPGRRTGLVGFKANYGLKESY